jgi:hypothetical protein
VSGGGQHAAVAFSCKKGYVLSGSRTRKCQATGHWSGNPTFCTLNQCIMSTALPHGKAVRDKLGATFQCDFGYMLVGNPTLRCKEGNWANGGKRPKCVRTCGHPTSVPQNAYLLSLQTPISGAKAVYKCDVGFHPKSGSQGLTSVCDDGAWGPPNFQCNAVGCSPPPKITHAVYNTNGGGGDVANYNRNGVKVPYGVGIIAEYMCSDGYQMLGSKVITCGTSGTWSTAPVCTIFRQCSTMGCKLTTGNRVDIYRIHSLKKAKAITEHERRHHKCAWDAQDLTCSCICWTT